MNVSFAGLRTFWLQVHSWLGIVLFLVLMPLGLTGSLLILRESIDRMSHPARYAVSHDGPRASLETLAASARAAAGPDKRLSGLRLPDRPGRPAVAQLAPVKPPAEGRRPPQQSVWLDPVTAKILDQGAGMTGLNRFAHDFHGQLLVPPMGRKIVGWLGWAMLISSLTGIWLWSPRTGGLQKGLRWRRTVLLSANLHHLGGLLVAIPLALLSLTGIWISFPDSARALTGQAAPAQRGGPGAMEGMRGGFGEAPPTPHLSADQALASAQTLHPSDKPTAITWPAGRRMQWRVQFAAGHGSPPQEVSVDDRSGEARAERARQGGDPVARFMRRLHEGEGFTPLWTAIVFLTGLMPTLLGLTGAWMFVRRKRVHAASSRFA